MARETTDREDLLREATALVERVEVTIAEFPDPIVVGFRRDGAGSIYFGGDPVYQFNARGELRRAFVDGRMLKADRGALASLERHPTETETQLVRHDLTAGETDLFLAVMQERLKELGAALAARRHRILGQVPETADLIGRIQAWLAALPDPPKIACSPGVQGPRT